MIRADNVRCVLFKGAQQQVNLNVNMHGSVSGIVAPLQDRGALADGFQRSAVAGGEHSVQRKQPRCWDTS